MEPVAAAFDPSLSAVVCSRRALRFAAGPDAALDRPGHVRAGSTLAWVGARLAVLQDDANFIALVDLATGHVADITLAAGDGGARQFDDVRGNKHAKLDLEATVVVPSTDGPALLGFGSGSTARREFVLVARDLDGPSPRVDLVHAPSLYAALRADEAFAGSELNLEGAALVGGAVRLFQRGNGAPRGALAPVDATCDLALDALLAHLAAPTRTPAPAHAAVTRYALGAVAGCRLTFTDAVAVGARVYYLAAAERSPDATRDGPVEGVALGVIEGDRARWTLLRDPSGAALADKAEGLALDPADPSRALVVIDRDDPDAPSELCEVALAGPW